MGAKVFNTAKGNYENVEQRINPAVWGWNCRYQCEHIFRQLNLKIYTYTEIYTHILYMVCEIYRHTYICVYNM